VLMPPPNVPDRIVRVLLVDDDTELGELVREYLAREGFLLEVEADGTRAVDRARSGDYQLVVLDVMLPGVSGFDILRHLRGASRVPVLMLTARGDDVDRIVGLELGADDYLSKPFNPRKLVARIRAILRRASYDAAPDSAKPVEERLGVAKWLMSTRLRSSFSSSLHQSVIPFSSSEPRSERLNAPARTARSASRARAEPAACEGPGHCKQ